MYSNAQTLSGREVRNKLDETEIIRTTAYVKLRVAFDRPSGFAMSTSLCMREHKEVAIAQLNGL